MKIENRENARKIKLIFFLLPIMFVLTVGPLLIFDVTNGFEIVVTLAIIIVLTYIVINSLGFNYLEISIDDKAFQIKYFGLAPLNKEYKAVKMKPTELMRYELKKTYFGLKTMLSIYRKNRGELYKYPPVNINTLNKNQKNQLKKALDLLIKINTQLT